MLRPVCRAAKFGHFEQETGLVGQEEERPGEGI